MTRILTISGSLRKHSYNRALVRAAEQRFPDQIEVGSIDDIPLYNFDMEQQDFPDSVIRLKKKLIAADGLLIATPEYNQAMPGVLKNTIDWLSRPSLDVRNAFRGKPVALIGASPGRFGTVLSQDSWLPVFRGLGARLWNGSRLMVAGAGQVFDEQGDISDSEIRERLEKFVEEFISYCES